MSEQRLDVKSLRWNETVRFAIFSMKIERSSILIDDLGMGLQVI